MTLATFIVFITMPKWAWYLTAVLLGIGWELLVDPSTWWLGLGVGGAAWALTLVLDLVLVVTDWAKVSVLRHSRRPL